MNFDKERKLWLPSDYATPLGFVSGELAYAEVNSNVLVNSTGLGTLIPIVTAPAVILDGSTAVDIHFFCPRVVYLAGATLCTLFIALLDGATNLGNIAQFDCPISVTWSTPMLEKRRIINPSLGTHTYGIVAYAQSTANEWELDFGIGGAGTLLPGYIRVVKA